MNFQCKNCGANMVFAPEKQSLYCPFCDGVGCEEQRGDDSLVTCASCGGELEIGSFTSATQCPFCGNYIILDQRVSGSYHPDKVIPFKLSLKDAVNALEKESNNRFFTPSSFLSEKTLVDMKGHYVPFFLYDYQVVSRYETDATKTRRWREGNYDCTEVTYYKLYRTLKAQYDNIPVDASLAMPDEWMDLLEPYEYDFLTDFDPRVMSGFSAETYNLSANELVSRADKKALESIRTYMMESMSSFSVASTPDVNDNKMKRGTTELALLPVWKYTYQYRGKEYEFYVNGQSGKAIGKTPISKGKVVLYAITCAALWGFIVDALLGMLGAWLF